MQVKITRDAVKAGLRIAAGFGASTLTAMVVRTYTVEQYETNAAQKAGLYVTTVGAGLLVADVVGDRLDRAVDEVADAAIDLKNGYREAKARQ